jgi:hypothetical protein
MFDVFPSPFSLQHLAFEPARAAIIHPQPVHNSLGDDGYSIFDFQIPAKGALARLPFFKMVQ